MDFDTDIAIVGGGLNGPTLALALAQIGLRVTLIDRLPAAILCAGVDLDTDARGARDLG
jgi:2-polyprenyl-6-methoxyphenol hydroxylase-like FAD-dependent oxidoreductase